MIRFFKSQQPATLFIIPLVVFILWFQAFFRQPFIVNENGTPLYNLFLNFLGSLPVFLQVLITMSFISIEAIYLNNIMNRYEVLYKSSYLPAFMYTLLMSLSFPLLSFNPVIPAAFFLIRALDKTFALFKNDAPVPPLFDGCFLIAVASLIYYPSAIFFVLFLVALAILRPFSVREWMISTIGFFLPYFFLGVYFFWTDQLKSGWKSVVENLVMHHAQKDFIITKPFFCLLVLLGFILLLSMNLLRQNFYKNVIRTRSNQQILLLFLILAAVSSWMLKVVSLYHFTLMGIPLSVFFGYFFLAVKKRVWLSELLLWSLIVLIVWNHF
jgi:hypothetical protein